MIPKLKTQKYPSTEFSHPWTSAIRWGKEWKNTSPINAPAVNASMIVNIELVEGFILNILKHKNSKVIRPIGIIETITVAMYACSTLVKGVNVSFMRVPI